MWDNYLTNPKKIINNKNMITEVSFMKKLLSTIVAALFLATAAYAHCPCQNDGQMPPPPPKCDCQKIKKDCPPDCKCPKCDKEKFAQECFKKMEAKKAEFEKRLNLTDEQKSKMSSLHEKQMKKMRKLDSKIRKQEEKIGELKRKKMEVKKECIEAFEATLTEEQKAELKKIKQEHFEQMKKFEGKGCPSKCKCPPCCPCHKSCPDKCKKDCPQKEHVQKK